MHVQCRLLVLVCWKWPNELGDGGVPGGPAWRGTPDSVDPGRPVAGLGTVKSNDTKLEPWAGARRVEVRPPLLAWGEGKGTSPPGKVNREPKQTWHGVIADQGTESARCDLQQMRMASPPGGLLSCDPARCLRVGSLLVLSRRLVRRPIQDPDDSRVT